MALLATVEFEDVQVVVDYVSLEADLRKEWFFCTKAAREALPNGFVGEQVITDPPLGLLDLEPEEKASKLEALLRKVYYELEL